MSTRTLIMVVFAAGALALAIALVMHSLGGGGLPPRPDSTLMLDIESGEVFRVRLRDGVVIPFVHPDTGNATLFPVADQLVSNPNTEPSDTPADDMATAPHVSLRYLEGSGIDPESLARFIDPLTGRLLFEIAEPIRTLN